MRKIIKNIFILVIILLGYFEETGKIPLLLYKKYINLN